MLSMLCASCIPLQQQLTGRSLYRAGTRCCVDKVCDEGAFANEADQYLRKVCGRVVTCLCL